jgi:hypothetical protein
MRDGAQRIDDEIARAIRIARNGIARPSMLPRKRREKSRFPTKVIGRTR